MRAATPVTSIRDLAPPLTQGNMVPSQAGGKEDTHTHTHTHTERHLKVGICKKTKETASLKEPLGCISKTPSKLRGLNSGSLLLFLKRKEPAKPGRAGTPKAEATQC